MPLAIHADDLTRIAAHMHRRAKGNAKARGIEYHLTVEDVENLLRVSGYQCAVSGKALTLWQDAISAKGPWGPSIDRIDSSQPYIAGNVRIVCVAANVAMNQWGEDVLVELAFAVAGHKLVTGRRTTLAGADR